jgi:hypothetical protein
MKQVIAEEAKNVQGSCQGISDRGVHCRRLWFGGVGTGGLGRTSRNCVGRFSVRQSRTVGSTARVTLRSERGGGVVIKCAGNANKKSSARPTPPGSTGGEGNLEGNGAANGVDGGNGGRSPVRAGVSFSFPRKEEDRAHPAQQDFSRNAQSNPEWSEHLETRLTKTKTMITRRCPSPHKIQRSWC